MWLKSNVKYVVYRGTSKYLKTVLKRKLFCWGSKPAVNSWRMLQEYFPLYTMTTIIELQKHLEQISSEVFPWQNHYVLKVPKFLHSSSSRSPLSTWVLARTTHSSPKETLMGEQALLGQVGPTQRGDPRSCDCQHCQLLWLWTLQRSVSQHKWCFWTLLSWQNTLLQLLRHREEGGRDQRQAALSISWGILGGSFALRLFISPEVSIYTPP